MAPCVASRRAVSDGGLFLSVAYDFSSFQEFHEFQAALEIDAIEIREIIETLETHPSVSRVSIILNSSNNFDSFKSFNSFQICIFNFHRIRTITVHQLVRTVFILKYLNRLFNLF